mmetsp:Transcript_17907/g.17975  ORF Transcript_17907/g.17975 Transcript_17907/m.17975 type:complete len:187 (-) Transcript_17907:286-846(-)|eukprot:CAMPEP_0182423780 /NCGR_PEP_ID=MMETSP1167-20130531/9862_1 /TAXON_ID=2988 /ORGANISM="Mallomonas Sp, Strain CCMP3275" /LENGTH=186 /DNA_ID=CAMNT_0024603055 /DNA_START=43 /DNA_END=603 /DNA_ORIENTATION=-
MEAPGSPKIVKEEMSKSPIIDKEKGKVSEEKSSPDKKKTTVADADNPETALSMLLSVAEGMDWNASPPLSPSKKSKDDSDNNTNHESSQKDPGEKHLHEEDPTSDDSGDENGYEESDDKNSSAANLRKKRKRELSRASHARMRQQIGSKLQRVVALLREFRQHENYRLTVGVATGAHKRHDTTTTT